MQWLAVVHRPDISRDSGTVASFLHESPGPARTAAAGGAGLPAAATSTSPEGFKDPTDGCTSNHRCVTQEKLQEAQHLASLCFGDPPGSDDDGGG